ncbi:MAG: nuclear transport factor 2 family protein [Myxococcota bacterium]
MRKSHDPALGVAAAVSTDEDPVPQTTSLTKELGRVEEANTRFYEAFALRDLDRMGQVWSTTPYCRCVHPGWELVVGWHDIRKSWSEIFSSIVAVEFELEDVHVEVAHRSAWVNLIAHVDITTNENENFQATVVTTNVFEKFDDDWRMVLHHSSNYFEDEAADDEDELEDFDPSPGSGMSNAN